ncbi:hypothetical protein BHM03_00062526 [Ensete ventricosum]|nr:hypothetical protein BHM03_00062526 [Ensete ventricosum]
MGESYGGRAAATAWGEVVTRHTTLMDVELGSIVFDHLHLEYQIAKEEAVAEPCNCRHQIKLAMLDDDGGDGVVSQFASASAYYDGQRSHETAEGEGGTDPSCNVGSSSSPEK